MKVFLFITALFVQQALSTPVERLVIGSDWASHKAKYDLKFSSDADEAAAKANYDKVDAMIQQHNSESHSYSIGHNEFSHLSDEAKASMNGAKIEHKRPGVERAFVSKRKRSSLPSSIDWRNYNGENYVNTPLNQGQCGSCWTFSGTTVLESRYAIKYGADKLVQLSEQNIVDCCHPGTSTSSGCDGGWYTNAWAYAASGNGEWSGDITGSNSLYLPKNLKGQNLLSSYPYTAKYGTCAFKNSASDIGVAMPAINETQVKYGYTWTWSNNAWHKKYLYKTEKVSSVSVTASDNDAMMEAVAEGPVSVAIEVINKFYYYTGGIFESAGCGTSLDHAVQIIGYGSDSTGAYWLMKNSWGTSWGDGGYFKFERKTASTKWSGTCGVLLQGAYPIV